MPFMTGLQAATEILKINPEQRILFVSGYLEKILEILSRLEGHLCNWKIIFTSCSKSHGE